MIRIYTDGACGSYRTEGHGGWGVVIYYGEYIQELSGNAMNTTFNRMELTAAIEGLVALKCRYTSTIAIYTDSRYVKNGITNYVHKWKVNGWTTVKKKEVKNKDLWQLLDTLSTLYKIEWHWVKAHNGNAGNEHADQLAVAAKEKLYKVSKILGEE